MGLMSSGLLQTRADALIDDFSLLETWEDRISHVIDLGRHAAPLAAHERMEGNKIRGCASQVWIVAEPSASVDGALHVRGQSDAAIVQGLVTLLAGLYSDAAPAEIVAFDADAFMARLGLAGALTAQRANGLASMIKAIRAKAAAHLAQSPG